MEKPHRLTVEYLALDELRFDPRNPREHPPHTVSALASSIASLGFNVPILVDRNKKILAGHGRALAARKLGLAHVPVIHLEDLSEAQARTFALADNRLQEHSRWNPKLLGEVLKELTSLELDFRIEDTGFSAAEIDFHIGTFSDHGEEEVDPADEIPAFSDEPPVSAAGDLWTLGRHRLLCGDALDRRSFGSVMGHELARIVVADFPYNVRIRGHASGKGRIKHREFAMASGEMASGQFVRSFLTPCMRHLVRHSVDGSLHYHFMDWAHAFEILTAGRRVYTELKNICIWSKTCPGMGSLYRSQHEMVFLFKNGRGPHKNHIELGRHGRNRTNVWTYPGVNGFGRHGEEGNLLALHPTVKSVRLIADVLLDASSRNDIVLDPMAGSGSTLIAAERVGRICRAIEIDALYCDTVVRRWQRFTGDHAIHVPTGTRFDELLQERRRHHG